jgi:xylonate dehydratase
MLHLRRLGVLKTEALTVTGKTWGQILDEWEISERRTRFRELLLERDGVDPQEVIFSPDQARTRGLTSTVCFPRGNIAPEGAVVKSTAIDPSIVDADGIYRKQGPARVFTRETEAIAAIKKKRIQAGDVLVLIGGGPMGTGMEETYQLTSALKHLPFGKEVALITDARFSGVSTGACLGHVGPEALAGGPVGKLRDGDWIEIVIDREKLEGSVNLIGAAGQMFSPEEGRRVLQERLPHPELSPHPALPEETRLWAALQQAGGGTWGGCVYDVDRIVQWLESGKQVLSPKL